MDGTAAFIIMNSIMHVHLELFQFKLKTTYRLIIRARQDRR